MSLSELPHVKADTFEGPFDLLLQLAREHKVDLTSVSLREITDDYLTYINENTIPMSLKAEFLLVATTLLLLKMRQVLPSLEPEEEEEVELLEDRLKLFAMFQETSLLVQNKWQQAPLWPAAQRVLEKPETPPEISLSELAATMQNLVGKLTPPKHAERHLRQPGRSLRSCRELLRERLAKIDKATFKEIMSGEERSTVAVSFLAALELVRLKEVSLEQPKHFSDIKIKKHVA